MYWQERKQPFFKTASPTKRYIANFPKTPQSARQMFRHLAASKNTRFIVQQLTWVLSLRSRRGHALLHSGCRRVVAKIYHSTTTFRAIYREMICCMFLLPLLFRFGIYVAQPLRGRGKSRMTLTTRMNRVHVVFDCSCPAQV